MFFRLGWSDSRELRLKAGPFRARAVFAQTSGLRNQLDSPRPPRPCSVITPSHVSICRPVPRNAGSPHACPSESPTGESRTTSTTRRAEASASAAKTRPARQALLGRRPPILVRMSTIPHCGPAPNAGALTQGRIPLELEADLQSQEARRETTDIEGSSGIDFPDGR